MKLGHSSSGPAVVLYLEAGAYSPEDATGLSFEHSLQTADFRTTSTVAKRHLGRAVSTDPE